MYLTNHFVEILIPFETLLVYGEGNNHNKFSPLLGVVYRFSRRFFVRLHGDSDALKETTPLVRRKRQIILSFILMRLVANLANAKLYKKSGNH